MAEKLRTLFFSDNLTWVRFFFFFEQANKEQKEKGGSYELFLKKLILVTLSGKIEFVVPNKNQVTTDMFQ